MPWQFSDWLELWLQLIFEKRLIIFCLDVGHHTNISKIFSSHLPRTCTNAGFFSVIVYFILFSYGVIQCWTLWSTSRGICGRTYPVVRQLMVSVNQSSTGNHKVLSCIYGSECQSCFWGVFPGLCVKLWSQRSRTSLVLQEWIVACDWLDPHDQRGKSRPTLLHLD